MGRVRPGFHWNDSSDTRDVREVLEEDGISFDDEGRADLGLRLGVSDLSRLI